MRVINKTAYQFVKSLKAPQEALFERLATSGDGSLSAMEILARAAFMEMQLRARVAVESQKPDRTTGDAVKFVKSLSTEQKLVFENLATSGDGSLSAMEILARASFIKTRLSARATVESHNGKAAENTSRVPPISPVVVEPRAATTVVASSASAAGKPPPVTSVTRPVGEKKARRRRVGVRDLKEVVAGARGKLPPHTPVASRLGIANGGIAAGRPIRTGGIAAARKAARKILDDEPRRGPSGK
ncbi:MAG: hypothetical protein P1U63_10475 [Coxiellaceae bacterium]|nr:hypothetical protein [Coxiellaceae bacterium]